MADKLKKNFTDTEKMPEVIIKTGKSKGKSIIDTLWSLCVGAGTSVFRADISGIWLGAKKWIDGPFRVDMSGNVIASSLTVTGGSVTGIVLDADTLDGNHAGAFTMLKSVISHTNQNANIVSTNMTASVAGAMYLIEYYLQCTTADGAATSVLVTFIFTDSAGATSVVSSTLSLATLGRTSGVFVAFPISGQLTYSTTVVNALTSKYRLDISSIKVS